MNKELLERYFRGEKCTEEELLLMEGYLDKAGEPEAFFFEQWKMAKGTVPAEESEGMWKNIESKIPVREMGRRKRRMSVAAAAAVVGVILLSAVIYNGYVQPVQSTVWNKIENTSKDIKYIRLDDGTEVWLNVHSSLAIDDGYAHNGKREIKLEGEAFFEVAQDPAHPFTVHTRQLRTTVLGTSFNIRAWPSQARTQVALVSGKVRVSPALGKDGVAGGAGADSMVLLPGEVLNYDSVTRGSVVMEKAVRGDMTGWVKGKIVLDNTPLPELLQQLEEIYKVSIVYDTDKLAAVKLSGQFRRDRIGDVLKNVLFPLDLTYSYEDGKYLVHKVTQH